MTADFAPMPGPARRLPAWVIVLGIVVLFIAGLLVLLLVNPPQRSLCDSAAPDFELPLFADYTGGWSSNSISLADLRGKGVVVNFWASWCKPCEEEAAALEAAWREYKDQGIVFLGVDYLDQEPAAMRYLEKFKISYPNGPDLQGQVSRRYTISGVPETFFVDPEGNIVGCRKKGPLTASELRQRLEEIRPQG